MKKTIEALNQALCADQNETALCLIDKIQKTTADGMVPLFRVEALLGVGRIPEAEAELKQIQSESSDAIAEKKQIMQGILLTAMGRSAEALDSFEAGIHPDEANSCQGSRVFGRIWRELAVSYFGDLGCSHRLQELARTLSNDHQDYLSILSDVYALVTKIILRQPVAVFESKPVLERLDAETTPGLLAMAQMAALLGGAYEQNEITARVNDVIRLCLRCEGIKGGWTLIPLFEAQFYAEIQAVFAVSEFHDWVNQYIRPILDEIASQESNLFPNLPDTPFLHSMNYAHCDGRCCYDGVYITTVQEKEIRSFMQKYPQYFGHVPVEFMEEGEWGFLFGGKRTLRRPHAFTTRTDYPAHFLATKCVFAYPNGECSLQKAATELGYHPWKYKPTSCWEFPMIGFFNEDAMTHPHYFGVPDPGYCDEKNPGYVSFMPCAVTFSEGISWKKVYKNEIQYFLYQQEKKKKETDLQGEKK
jgi:hypothetical protein